MVKNRAKIGQIMFESTIVENQVHFIEDEKRADAVKEVKCSWVEITEFLNCFFMKPQANLIPIFSKNLMLSGIGVQGMRNNV